MAFLSAVPRFGPDLDSVGKQYPNPSTYEPAFVTIARSTSPSLGLRVSSRYGTIGHHHDASIESIASKSAAARALAAAEPSPKSPSPWQYTPQIEGEFERVFTAEDLDQKRMRRLQEARRREKSAAVDLIERPIEVQHLELGPGTYEVDKDWNLETIAVPFSFPQERRHGILDHTLGEKVHPGRDAKYSKRLTSEQRRRSELALLPLKRVSSVEKGDPALIAPLSKELAKSYADLHRTASRLERKLTSPEARAIRFRRFDKAASSTGPGEIEASGRGPGTYFAGDHAGTGDGAGLALSPPSELPLDEHQRQELETLLKQANEHTRRPLHGLRKPKSSFGYTTHRDLLTSLSKAGHLSAVAVDANVGPGIYETATTLHEVTHNLLLKTQTLPNTTKRTGALRRKATVPQLETTTGSHEDVKQRWQQMRRGPSWNPQSQVDAIRAKSTTHQAKRAP